MAEFILHKKAEMIRTERKKEVDGLLNFIYTETIIALSRKAE